MQENHIDIDLVVCGVRDVFPTLETGRAVGRPFDGVISIHSSRPQELLCMPSESLRLPEWFDALTRRVTIDCPEYGKFTNDERLNFIAGIENAASFVETRAQAAPGGKPRILIHCHAGNTRSVAVAIALLEAFDPYRMTLKISEILQSRPHAVPDDEQRDYVLALAGRALRRRVRRAEAAARLRASPACCLG